MGQDEIIIEIGQLKVRISPQKAIKSKNENDVVEGVKQGIRPASPAKEIKSASLQLYMEQTPLLFGIGQTSLKAQVAKSQ